jgi:hypothetical protein
MLEKTTNYIASFYFVYKAYFQTYLTILSQWRSLGLFSSEAIHRAQRGEKMLGGVQKLEKKMGD